MLFICFRAYMYLDETPKKYVAIAFWGSVCFVLLAEKLVTQEHFHFIVYYVALLFLAAYAGLIYLYKGGRRRQPGSWHCTGLHGGGGQHDGDQRHHDEP